MEIPTCCNFQRVPAYMPVTLTDGVKKLVLEGVARAKYDSDCCFCGRLSARLGTHEPQAYRVHAPVVNTALETVTAANFWPRPLYA